MLQIRILKRSNFSPFLVISNFFGKSNARLNFLGFLKNIKLPFNTVCKRIIDTLSDFFCINKPPSNVVDQEIH